MRTLPKAVSLLMVILMLAASVTACTSAQPSQPSTAAASAAQTASAVAQASASQTASVPQEQLPRQASYDVKKELQAYSGVMTLTGYYNMPWGVKVDPKNYFHDWVLENLKIDIQNTYASGENYGDKVRALSAANQLPDVLMGDKPLFDDLAGGGQLLALDDILTNYAPACDTWYAKEIRDMMRYKDGKLYVMVGYNMPIGNKEYQSLYFGGINWDQMFEINKTMLEQLKMQVPKTLDEMMAYLRAAVKLPDVNGNKVIGLEMGKFGPAAYSNTGYPGNGIKTVIMHMLEQTPTSDFTVPDDSNQTMKFAYDDPAYLKFLKFMNTLYRENLLDKETFIMSNEQVDAKMKQGRVAMSAFIANIEADNTAVSGGKTNIPYAPVDYPRDPSVTNINVLGVSPVGSWVYAINKNVKDPARLGKYIEWHLSDEGLMFDNYGPPDPTKQRNTWWYEAGTAPGGLKLEGKPTLDLPLQQKWDAEKAGWETDLCGTWGANSLGLRMAMTYAKPGEFGICMASDFQQEQDAVLGHDKDVYYYTDLNIVKFLAAPFGDVYKQKATNVNDLLNKWEVKIIMEAKSDTEVESMFAKMMAEARQAGYDEIAKEAYQVYLKAIGK